MHCELTSHTIPPLQGIIQVVEALRFGSECFDDTFNGHECLWSLAERGAQAGHDGKLSTLPGCPEPQ